MAKGQKAFTLDNEKKLIIIDKTVKKTAEDRADIEMYMRGGYTIYEKIIRKPKKGSISELKDADILKALESDAELLKQYKEIKSGTGKGKGFFAARSWYKKEVLGKKKK